MPPLAAAWTVVSEVLPPTPLIRAPTLSERMGREVLFKLESLQVTGSFKVRGALARLALLTEEERARGVVACSSGNHGRAVAWAAERTGVNAVVCVPGWVDPVKRAAIEAHGAEARLVGESYDEAEAEAERLAGESGRVLIHPFDDTAVVAGQGTLGMEILEARPDVAEVWAALSGGGLVAGIASALRAADSSARVVAVSARKARVMRASLEAGRPVELPEEPTLASALAGGIGLGNRVTFGLVRALVRDHREVSEDAIARAMRYAFRESGLVLEGGGATALAGLLEEQEARPGNGGGGPLVAVLSGGNVDPALLARVLGCGDG
ncbi:MAG: pyridoxal-phosphate dependent enzyme [Gemmatimonadota bacterium]